MTRPPLLTGPFLRSWIFTFITFSTAFQLFPTIPFRILDLGGTKSQAGLFLAIYTYACAFSAPLTGALADHFGRKRVLTIGAAAFAVASILYAVTTNLPLLLVVACVHGFFWSALLSSNSAIISEIIPESRRTEGIAFWGMASTIAVGVAPIVGLLLYKKSWMTLCIELATLAVVMVFLAARIHEQPRDREEKLNLDIRGLVDLRVVMVALSLFVVSISYGSVTSYVALLSEERRILPTSLFFTVTAIAILVSRFFTARIGDVYGARALLIPSCALIAPGVLLLAFADSVWTMSLAAVLYGIGFGGAYPAFVTYVLPRTDPRRRAAVFGSILWAFDTGIGTGSFVTGQIVDARGFQTAFVVCAGIAALSVPIFLITSKRFLPTDSVH